MSKAISLTRSFFNFHFFKEFFLRNPISGTQSVTQILGRSKRKHLLSSSSGAAVQPQYFDSADDYSSTENDDENEDDNLEYNNDKGGHAYINLAQKSYKFRQNGGGSRCWNITRNHKFFGLCRGLCLCFIILNGFFVLVALTWLHFSLRAQTQEMNTQLHQGVFLLKKKEFSSKYQAPFF